MLGSLAPMTCRDGTLLDTSSANLVIVIVVVRPGPDIVRIDRLIALLCFCGRVFDTTHENSPGPDTVRIDRLKALSWICGAVPFLVDGVKLSGYFR